MGSGGGGAYLLLRKRPPTPEEAAAILAVLFAAFSAFAIGFGIYALYERVAPNSETNSDQVRREVAIEKCFAGQPTGLNSSFDDRFSRVQIGGDEDVINYSPLADMSNINQITVSWLDRQITTTVQDEIGNSYPDSQRYFIKKAIIDPKDMAASQLDYWHMDTYKPGKHSYSISYQDGAKREQALPPADRTTLLRAQACALRFMPKPS